jgi:vacuolar protein sorting-associated protein 13D
VNPETWIILLDLLGFGAKFYPPLNRKEPKQDYFAYFNQEKVEKKPSNIGIYFDVEHFSIQLNNSGADKKLAKFTVENVNTFIESRSDFLKVKGTLGSLTIYDMSRFQGLYFERFLTSGKQALVFELFKYTGPFELIRSMYEYESMFKIKMNTVKYVHTQRFVATLMNYFQQFNQLYDALGRMKALSIGKNISFQTQGSSRVKLEISTAAPIVIIPINHKSEKCLVINLGSINIKNKFLVDGADGTFSFKKLKEQFENMQTGLNSTFKENNK